MEFLDKLILTTHIASGTISLILFWIPVMVKKGSKVHNNVGKAYVFFMWIVLTTSIALSVINSLQGMYVLAAFLGYLGLLTGQPLWYAIAITKHKKVVPLHIIKIQLVLKYALIIFGAVLIIWSIALSLKGLSVLLLIFGLLGIFASIRYVRASRKDLIHKTSWLYDHLDGMVVSGIAAYTAFFAFGGSQMLSSFLPGPMMAIPWMLPTVIGRILISRYTKSFNLKNSLAK